MLYVHPTSNPKLLPVPASAHLELSARRHYLHAWARPFNYLPTGWVACVLGDVLRRRSRLQRQIDARILSFMPWLP
jgi:hypothetical protein